MPGSLVQRQVLGLGASAPLWPKSTAAFAGLGLVSGHWALSFALESCQAERGTVGSP